MSRALEVCYQNMVFGSVDKPHLEPTSAPRPWGFDAVADTVVGMIAFGLVDDKPGSSDWMPQLYVRGTTPGLAERLSMRSRRILCLGALRAGRLSLMGRLPKIAVLIRVGFRWASGATSERLLRAG